MNKAVPLVALALGAVAGLLLTAHPASAIDQQWRMRLWMAPPMESIGSRACLSDRWHASAIDDPTHSLDWKKDCPPDGSRAVLFRAHGAAPDDEFDVASWAEGDPIQSANIGCGDDEVRYAQVVVTSTWDGLEKGRATYQHVVVDDPAPFDIYFQRRRMAARILFQQQEIR